MVNMPTWLRTIDIMPDCALCAEITDDDKKSNHARTCPQAPLQGSCHEVTEGLLAYAQLTGYAKNDGCHQYPDKKQGKQKSSVFPA